MNNPNDKNEKNEIIEQALLESVSGGTYDVSGVSVCKLGCRINLSAIACTTPAQPRQ